jgi:hypothetical protein
MKKVKKDVAFDVSSCADLSKSKMPDGWLKAAGDSVMYLGGVDFTILKDAYASKTKRKRKKRKVTRMRSTPTGMQRTPTDA